MRDHRAERDVYTGEPGYDLRRKVLDFATVQSNINARRHPVGRRLASIAQPRMHDSSLEGVSAMSSQPRRRRLEVEPIGDVTVVNFIDRKILDEQNIQIIGEQLFSLADVDGRRKILLNFGNVEYLSSAALGKLITLNKKLQQAQGKLILCNIDPQIHEVFEITKLDKFFKIMKEEQQALQAF